MNKGPLALIVIGIILILVGIIMWTSFGEGAEETIEEGMLYEGADGEMEITGVSDNDEIWFVVHIESTYEGGGEGGYNEEHGNNTWNLTESDCEMIKNFTLTHNEDDTQVFIPRCNYIEDDGGSAQEDDWIVVGTLCTQKMAEDRKIKGNGCPDGTYTWDTGGERIMVYDVGKLIEGIIGAILGALGSFGACCCGIVVLIIGIVLAFTMADDNAKQEYGAENTDHALLNNNQGDGFKSYEEKRGWDQQEDYIHKEKKEKESQEVKEEDSKPEEKPSEKKRNGEYELPPPPEY